MCVCICPIVRGKVVNVPFLTWPRKGERTVLILFHGFFSRVCRWTGRNLGGTTVVVHPHHTHRYNQTIDTKPRVCTTCTRKQPEGKDIRGKRISAYVKKKQTVLRWVQPSTQRQRSTVHTGALASVPTFQEWWNTSKWIHDQQTQEIPCTKTKVESTNQGCRNTRIVPVVDPRSIYHKWKHDVNVRNYGRAQKQSSVPHQGT